MPSCPKLRAERKKYPNQSTQVMTDPIKLYGVKISMFTGKVRSYLIKQGLEFEEIAPFSAHFRANILPVYPSGHRASDYPRH